MAPRAVITVTVIERVSPPGVEAVYVVVPLGVTVTHPPAVGVTGPIPEILIPVAKLVVQQSVTEVPAAIGPVGVTVNESIRSCWTVSGPGQPRPNAPRDPEPSCPEMWSAI